MHDPPQFDVEGAPIRMLLIEDDPEDVRRLEAMLQQAQGAFEVDHATEVERGLEMLARGEYQVVLLDLTSPESDGAETLARARIAASTVPIIAMSCRDDEAQALDALRLGAQEYVSKGGIDAQGLGRVVRQAVERHRLLAELEQARRREHHLATHDALTGLPDRFQLEDQLSRAIAFAQRTGRRVAVLFLDLDRFKYINDTLGHQAGDELLRAVARRLSPRIRGSDMLARVGGDEFTIMLQDAKLDEDPARMAEKILASLAEPFVVANGEYWITASIGIAIFPRDGSDPASLIQNADTAMYQAKGAGKNGYRFFELSMNEAVHDRLDMERRLRNALDRELLEVHYQPRVALEDGRITGAEALLRWRDPEVGDIPPADFIPVAEETGLITALGVWMLRSACRDARRWHAAGFASVRVSVNVSTREITRSLHESTLRALREASLDPSCLELEIAERALLDLNAADVTTLQELRRSGIRIVLDDFGTGFSSLSRLKEIPIDAVKIDRSFVAGLAVDANQTAIARAIVSIAEQFDLDVVAEGVETSQQRDFLKTRGCLEMQGHLFSPAVPFEAFLELLRDGQGRPPAPPAA